MFIYYRGKNDAWDGYGGAVVYTKSSTLPTSIIPELGAAAKKVNLDFKKFTTTDNTCGPEPPLLARLEKKVTSHKPVAVLSLSLKCQHPSEMAVKAPALAAAVNC